MGVFQLENGRMGELSFSQCPESRAVIVAAEDVQRCDIVVVGYHFGYCKGQRIALELIDHDVVQTAGSLGQILLEFFPCGFVSTGGVNMGGLAQQSHQLLGLFDIVPVSALLLYKSGGLKVNAQISAAEALAVSDGVVLGHIRDGQEEAGGGVFVAMISGISIAPVLIICLLTSRGSLP